MSGDYAFTKSIHMPMNQAVEHVTQKLKEGGFGVVTDINMQETLKQKLGKDLPGYRILGACSPQFAFQALSIEPLIGTMLPCNVVIREVSTNECEISVVDPIASMMAIRNPKLEVIAKEVQSNLKKVSERI